MSVFSYSDQRYPVAMRERLVSYLLGELDEAQAAQLEQQIERDSQLAKQLELLRNCMAADQTDQSAAGEEPPTGLAARTADSVHDLVIGLSSDAIEVPLSLKATEPEVEPPQSVDAPSSGPSFTFVDACVAAGVVMAVGMMLLPALYESREASRRAQCRNNLREIGVALQQYAHSHSGLFPHVHPGENAGVFAVRLVDSGLIDRDEMSRLVLCVGSPLADKVAHGKVTIRIPSARQLQELRNPVELVNLRRIMGGSYAFRIGYLEGPVYLPIRNRSSSRSPLLSDAPRPENGHWQSPNHGGCGLNVLFEDGSVGYRSSCYHSAANDNIFVNAKSKPAAGLRWNDAVLLSSERTPGVLAATSPHKPRAVFRNIPRTEKRNVFSVGPDSGSGRDLAR